MMDISQIKQIWNEKRINLWLWVELLLVSVVLWYVVDELYTNLFIYTEPKGFNIEDTYQLGIASLAPNSHEYQELGEEDPTPGESLLEIVSRLRHHPEIEAVSLSIHSRPYNGSNRTRVFRTDTFAINLIFREATPDFLKVFQYRGVNGESPEELISLFTSDNDFITGDNMFVRNYGITSMKPFVGKDFYVNQDTLHPCRLVAVTQPVRYADFQAIYTSAYVLGFMTDADIAEIEDSWWAETHELCLRTKPGVGPDFADRLSKSFESQYRSGNLFIKDIRSLQSIRHHFQLDEVNNMRNYLWGAFFLLINIFLGLLGTFWFRTQQRRSELALRMSFGSTRRGIFSYLIREGLFLLILATIPAICIDQILTMNEYNSWLNGTFMEIGRFTITVLITFALIALTIVLGIAYPAWQATKIEPAQALREE